MTRQHVSRTHQQSKSDTPLVSGILQRAAVRNVPEKDVQPIEKVEASTFRASRFHHNFSQVPVTTSEMPRIQPKLKIGAVGDRYEQEADRVAQNVVQRINAPEHKDEVMRKVEEETLQREEMPEDEEELRMKPEVQHLSAEGRMAAPSDLEASIQGVRGSGQALSDNIREPMEQAFGADFSGVRVHTDAKSDALNQLIQAKAFTTGQDVFFRQGVYELGSRRGQELIAHELTHVVQQNGGGERKKTNGGGGALTPCGDVSRSHPFVVQRGMAASRPMVPTATRGVIRVNRPKEAIPSKTLKRIFEGDKSAYITHGTYEKPWSIGELRGETDTERKTNPGTSGDYVHFLPSLNNEYGKYVILAKKDVLGAKVTLKYENAEYKALGRVKMEWMEGFVTPEQIRKVTEAILMDKDVVDEEG